MVGSAVNRAFLPAKSLFEQVGDMMILTARTLVSAVKPPYPYGEEFIGQFLFALQLCWFPLLVSTVAFGFGAPGLQAANFLSLFGALDRLGGFFVLASIREFAPFVTAVVVAGVAGTAITADLGARKIREELDALQVLGVDPIKNLVVPRFLALMLITGLLDIYALVFGISGGILTELLYNQSLGGFFATLFSNASITDLWGSVIKCTLFGAIIAVVCSYKGMTASGGAAGVGRAVNQAVVIAFMGVFALHRAVRPRSGHSPRRRRLPREARRPGGTVAFGDSPGARAADQPSRNGATGEKLGTLTIRERQVLDLLAQGLSQDEIAESLFISPKTVATHIQRSLTKLGVRHRTQAVALVLQRSDAVTAHVLFPTRAGRGAAAPPAGVVIDAVEGVKL